MRLKRDHHWATSMREANQETSMRFKRDHHWATSMREANQERPAWDPPWESMGDGMSEWPAWERPTKRDQHQTLERPPLRKHESILKRPAWEANQERPARDSRETTWEREWAAWSMKGVSNWILMSCQPINNLHTRCRPSAPQPWCI